MGELLPTNTLGVSSHTMREQVLMQFLQALFNCILV